MTAADWVLIISAVFTGLNTLLLTWIHRKL